MEFDDTKIFIILLVVLMAWFFLVLDWFTPFITDNPFLSFLIFSSLLYFLLLRFIVNLKFDLKQYVALYLINFVVGLLMFPMIVPLDEVQVASISPFEKISEDYFIYSIIDMFFKDIPHFFKYMIVYPVSIVGILFSIRYVMKDKKEYEKIVKGAVK